MSQKWFDAARRYEAAKKPGFKPRKKQPKPVDHTPTLYEFMKSNDASAAKKLLAAADSTGIVLTSEPAKSVTCSVVFSCNGLQTFHAGRYEYVSVKFANEVLASHHDNPVFDPVLFLRQELDRIADSAP